jgi:hypothetical protein
MAWHQNQIQLQDRLAHVLIDGRFTDAAPIAALPCINWFGVWCREVPSENEFIAANEESAMATIERQLIEISGEKANGWAVYCIRLISRGFAEYFLYSKDPSTLKDVCTELHQFFPEYRIEHEAKLDASWSEYFKYYETIL